MTYDSVTRLLCIMKINLSHISHATKSVLHTFDGAWLRKSKRDTRTIAKKQTQCNLNDVLMELQVFNKNKIAENKNAWLS